VVDLDLPTEEEEILEASGHPHTERSSIWDMPGDLPSPTRTGEREIKCRFPKCGRHCFSRTSELRYVNPPATLLQLLH
jgi:hypothetical protein